jgi:hypothetical protein
MLDRIFPRQIDNAYRGHRAGLWLLGAAVFLRLTTSGMAVVDPRRVAGADGIPLDSLGPAAAPHILELLALVGLGQVMLALFALLALVRYRAMVPLACLLLVVEHLARKAILTLYAAPTVASPGFYVSLFILGLLVAGFLLSLMAPMPNPGPLQPTPHPGASL